MALESFTWKPSIDVKFKRANSNLIISSFGTGIEQRRLRNSFDPKSAVFIFNIREAWEADQIEAFYVARSGGLEAFNWTDPVTSTVYKLRFVPGTWERDYIGKNKKHIWHITFGVVEIL